MVVYQPHLETAMADDERTEVRGTQTLNFDLLDDDLREKVIRCIQERSRISVIIGDNGVIKGDLGVAFRQLID
jgi:hypothetical protein